MINHAFFCLFLCRMNEILFKTEKTARICIEGALHEHTREVWMVIHGYGQLAPYFIRHFQALVSDTVAVVAPEGLSRFYIDGLTGRVGASWMTKENRQNEIEDYLHYLSQVYAMIKSEIGHTNFKLNVLGFSQGTATACRWVAEKQPPNTTLTCWAGFVPPDLKWNEVPPPQDLKMYVLTGTRDEFVTPEAIAKFEEIVTRLNIRPVRKSFEGGHEIHQESLLALAHELRNM